MLHFGRWDNVDMFLGGLRLPRDKVDVFYMCFAYIGEVFCESATPV